MACGPKEKSYGYESNRFERDVDEHFHCSICYNVLKEPRTCRNNEHMFCLDCITEHLNENSQTCPECNEHLSTETLRRPRVVNSYLSELKIICDFASRGCSEFVRVADLKTHVESCGFAPVLCSNDKCGMEINNQDKVNHEREVCEYRKVTCHEFGQIQEVIERLEGNVLELSKNVEVTRRETRNEVEVQSKEVKQEVRDVKEKVEAARRETKNEVEEMKKEVKDVKKNISKVSKDVDEVKVMINQMLKKFHLLEQINKLPSPSEGMMNTQRGDILIAGGSGPSMNFGQSTEIYSWEKNSWFEMSEMNEKHAGASSFICKDQLFVVGGYEKNTVETLDLNELRTKWMKFPGKLPYACDNHQTVVYQQRAIHIGGYNLDEDEVSNVISELQLSSPCVMKELCQMPEPRECHGAEIFKDKVLIMGGEKENNSGTLDSVLEFDVTRNKNKDMPPLPRALKNMATVRWRDKVVLLGGQDEDNDILNDVFMYHCKTGKITTLPSMLKTRSRCCAVITGDTIVVMGGYDHDGEDLSSVECFAMGGSTWEYLPDMNKARYAAIAEILPSTRKYV